MRVASVVPGFSAFVSPVMCAASAGRATGGALGDRATRYSRTRTASPRAVVSPVLARRVIVPSLVRLASQVRYQGQVSFSGLSSAIAVKAARAAASESAAAGRLRKVIIGRPVARLRAASSSASGTVMRLVPAAWWTPVMPMITLRSASSGAAMLTRPVSWPPVRSRDLRAAARSRRYSGPRYRSRPGSGPLMLCLPLASGAL